MYKTKQGHCKLLYKPLNKAIKKIHVIILLVFLKTAIKVRRSDLFYKGSGFCQITNIKRELKREDEIGKTGTLCHKGYCYIFINRFLYNSVTKTHLFSIYLLNSPKNIMMLIVKTRCWTDGRKRCSLCGLLGGVRLILIVHAIMRVNEMHTKIGSR